MYVTLAGLWCAGIVQASVNLFRPDWAGFRSVARLAMDLVWTGMVVIILGADRWVGALAPAAPSAVAQAAIVEGINRGLFIGLVVASIASVVIIVFDARRLIRAT